MDEEKKEELEMKEPQENNERIYFNNVDIPEQIYINKINLIH